MDQLFRPVSVQAHTHSGVTHTQMHGDVCLCAGESKRAVCNVYSG